jgi:hypothetical protein
VDVAQLDPAEHRARDAEINLQVLPRSRLRRDLPNYRMQDRPVKRDQQEHENADTDPDSFEPDSERRSLGRAGFIHVGVTVILRG